MDCKRIKEELVFLFADNEMGQELLISFRRHVSVCPHCARQAEYTRALLAVVRQRAVRRPVPRGLRTKILAGLPHRRGRKR